MIRFTRRLFGILVFDAGAYEDVESDPAAGWQSLTVVLLVCTAGGVALASRTALTLPAFAAACGAMVAGWAVWIGAIRLIGTGILAEPQTRSSVPELLRTLGKLIEFDQQRFLVRSGRSDRAQLTRRAGGRD